jgi:hypothetical protein
MRVSLTRNWLFNFNWTLFTIPSHAVKDRPHSIESSQALESDRAQIVAFAALETGALHDHQAALALSRGLPLRDALGCSEDAGKPSSAAFPVSRRIRSRALFISSDQR